MVQFVDWDLAATTAGTLSKSGPKVSYSEAAQVVAELRELTELAADHVRDFTQLRPQVDYPPVRVVDRSDWAAVNVAGLNKVFTPLVERLVEGREPSALAQAVGSRIAGVQAGTVLAYLSGKVLGQYEVFSTDPGQLLLVAPNIVEVERKLDAEPHDFRLWVCLHEVTHRTQFTAVPWMREKFFAEVAAFVSAAQLDTEQLVERVRRSIDEIARSIKDPRQSFNVMDLVQTPAQREVLDRLTAMMTLLEGHAEYVMDGVGPSVVPTVDEIRGKFNQRRESANPIERVVRKLLGVDVKLRQYAEGRKFVHGVVERVGMSGFNQVWTSAETLPRKSELSDPDAWVERVLGPRGVPGAGTSATSGNPGASTVTDDPTVTRDDPAASSGDRAGSEAAGPGAPTPAKPAKKAVKKSVRKAPKKASKSATPEEPEARKAATRKVTKPAAKKQANAVDPTHRIRPRKTTPPPDSPGD